MTLEQIQKDQEKTQILAVILSELHEMQKEDDRYIRSFIHDRIVEKLDQITQ